MRALLQRVTSAGVTLPSGERRGIGRGLVIFLGVGRGDTEAQARQLVEKIVALRIFPNAEGKFDRSLMDENGEALVISQFTLYGNAKGGRRPDFTEAASPQEARLLYKLFLDHWTQTRLRVQSGEFGASMSVDLINDGPVTLWLDTASL